MVAPNLGDTRYKEAERFYGMLKATTTAELILDWWLGYVYTAFATQQTGDAEVNQTELVMAAFADYAEMVDGD